VVDEMSDDYEVGDILRDVWPANDATATIDLGNGRFRASLDAFGLMNNSARGEPKANPADTVFKHADYGLRNASGVSIQLPLARLMWAGEAPLRPKLYSQEWRAVHGYCHTEMDWPTLSATFVSYFHPVQLDLFAFHISYEVQAKGSMPPLLLAPEIDIQTPDGQPLSARVRPLELSANFWLSEVEAADARSVLGLRILSSNGKVQLTASGDGVSIQFSGREGRHLLLIGAASTSRREALCHHMQAVSNPYDFLEESIKGWNKQSDEKEHGTPSNEP